MGSSISIILAISYKDQFDRRELSVCPSCILFTKYIDDILMLTSSSEETTAIFEKFQNIDKNIQFKIEHQDNIRSLSFLDFRIQISPTGRIYTTFFETPPLKTFLCISDQHFHSVPIQITLEMKLNEFTRDTWKKKTI